MATLSQNAIRLAWDLGHFWSFPNDVTQDKLHLLTPDDPVVVQAMISMARSNATVYTKAVLDHHGRGPAFDGEIGPAMIELMATHRCKVPDFAPPAGVVFAFEDPDLQAVVERMQADSGAAFGSGNWRGCHNVGEFHAAAIGVNVAGLPTFLQGVFKTVLTNVQRAYAGVGLLFRFIQSGKDMLSGESFSGNINSEMSFVSNSSGWIGLAIVGQGETCGGKIWCKFLSTYKGGSDTASIVTQWTTLIKHELGHNCGRGHTNGGVMNPSIVNNLPTDWVDNDPSTSWLRGQFGGAPVPIPGDDPKPPKPPTGTKTLEQRILDQEVTNAVQQATIDWLVAKERARG